MVKVAKFWSVSLQSGATKEDSNIGFYQGSLLEDEQTLKALDKKYNVSIVNILPNWNYFAIPMSLVEMRIKIVKIGLILSLGHFWQIIDKNRNLSKGVKIR